MPFVVCRACHRHIRNTEAACPFCKGANTALGLQRPAGSKALKRAALFALGASLNSACEMGDISREEAEQMAEETAGAQATAGAATAGAGGAGAGGAAGAAGAGAPGDGETAGAGAAGTPSDGETAGATGEVAGAAGDSAIEADAGAGGGQAGSEGEAGMAGSIDDELGVTPVYGAPVAPDSKQ